MVNAYEDLFVDEAARRAYLEALDELIESAKRYGYNRDYVGLLRHRERLMQEIRSIEHANVA